MSDSVETTMSRRTALQSAGALASAAALQAAIAPKVYAGVTDTINIGLVGCGGRGTGAVSDALKSANGPTKLTAMADVFEEKLSASYKNISEKHGSQTEVPPDKRFLGFDGYKHVMDSLRPGDIVILTTPVAFRWPMFQYAIEKSLNVFMEKPITVDGPSTRKMMALGELSKQKNLKVAVGLMCRHCDARGELFNRIQAGEIGDVTMLRAYRMAGPTGSAFAKPKPENMTELMYQIRNFHGFLWASGGGFSDFLIHNIDECCWMKNAWPVEAKASGGRHFRGEYVDQNFDSYSVEYTFADGAKLFLEGRTMPGCHNEFASYAHGTKGSAIISKSGHAPAKCEIFKGQQMTKENSIWKFDKPEPSPYQLEWDHFLESIRKDRPHNEVQRGAEASLVTAMGRLAAHTGRVWTYDEALNHEVDLALGIETLTMDSKAPLQMGENGKYPVPQPGLITDKEF